MRKKLLLLIIPLFLFAGCAASETQPPMTEATHTVQLANPWVSYDTLSEAEAAAGFSLSVPEEIAPFRAENFRVMNGQLLEVIYRDGDDTVTVRKQAGEGQDISGVFEVFEKETVYKTGNSWIIGRSSENRELNLIDSGGYSWSVYAPGDCPEDCRGAFLNAILGDTEPWIREANAAFNATVSINGGADRASEISCFFSCTWEAPEEIDLAAFLRYCPLHEQLLDENTEEAQAVMAAMGENPFLVTPVWRYPREEVSALLKKYTGITVEELNSRDGVLYLEEYDAFYNCTSDWGPGRFYCTGGEQIGDRITLRGKSGDGEERILTIREDRGTYSFLSYLKSE